MSPAFWLLDFTCGSEHWFRFCLKVIVQNGSKDIGYYFLPALGHLQKLGF